MSNREEKKAARVARYIACAEKAKQQSVEAWEQSDKAVEHIPLGQPILLGHHSERKHRAALARSHNAMDRSLKLNKKALYYQAKAEAAEYNNNIYLDDDEAVQKLEAKLAEAEALQTHMKAVNKIVLSKKISDTQKIEQLKVAFDYADAEAQILLAPDFLNRIGYADYKLKNNGAKIRNTKKQLERAKALKSTPTTEYNYKGVRVVNNTEENRLQLFFEGKPNEEIRNQLKKNGFRWSRFNMCWQSYLNRWQVDKAKEIINNYADEK